MASLAEVRAADAAASAAQGEAALIARASTALATAVRRLAGRTYGLRVVVLAGSGHNGADAAWAAAELARRGASVTLVESGHRDPDEHGRAARAALHSAGGRTGGPAALALADVVLDGMVGVGGGAGLRGRAAELARELAAVRHPPLVVAVDLPSGVDTGTGAIGDGPAVRADVTVTFDALKPGLVVGAAAELAGSVVVVEVGLGLAGTDGPLGVLTDGDVAALLPTAHAGDDKYSRGVVGLLTGSARYPGAAVLGVGGAVRAGAGYVRYLGSAADAVRARWPTAVVGEGRCDAVVAGSGLGTDDDAQQRVRDLLATYTPLVLDADALAVGADAIRGRRAPTLLTPHAGEFRRLTGTDPVPDPLARALAAAADLGATVLLKGQHTIVAAPDGTARINATGSPWLSTAGTGDVLGGAAGALVAALAKRGHDPATLARDAGALAAHLHGRAAWLASDGAPISADDLLETWRPAVRSVRSGS